MARFAATLPAGCDCVSVANTLSGWLENCRPIATEPASFDSLTGKLISPAKYSGVEAHASSKEDVEKLLKDLKIPFESVEAY